MPAAVSATDRLAAIDPPLRVAERRRHAVKAQGQAMNLLVIFIISLVIGQSLSVGLGLLVQRRKVIGERSRVSGSYYRPPDPCIDSSGRVSPNAVPFLPAATPTS